MIRPEDQRAIEDLFDRLRNVERNSAPRDPDAEALIRQELQRNPSAAYFMAQTIIVQEAALREQQARLEDMKQNEERGRGGFLGGIFGGDDEQRRQPERDMREVPERRSGPWGRRDVSGGGFLAGAAQTALGVTGGVLLGSAIAGMFNTPAMAEEASPADTEDAGADQEAADPGMDDGGGDWGGGDFDMGGEF